MLKDSENSGADEIGLVTPTPGLLYYDIGAHLRNCDDIGPLQEIHTQNSTAPMSNVIWAGRFGLYTKYLSMLRHIITTFIIISIIRRGVFKVDSGTQRAARVYVSTAELSDCRVKRKVTHEVCCLAARRHEYRRAANICNQWDVDISMALCKTVVTPLR